MEDEKEEAKEWFNKSKEHLLSELKEMKEKVKNRKIQGMELKYRVIKER